MKLSLPHNRVSSSFSSRQKNILATHKVPIAVIIPTFKPTETTLELVHSVRVFHPKSKVLVVNDCIPENTPEARLFARIQQMAKKDKGIICLRTERNSHKSGALNVGIQHIFGLKQKPPLIFTCDDDIIINSTTLQFMIAKMLQSPAIGAVCSRSLVKNKNANLLTRMQALEYFGFTITKIADNGFLRGPLVMQGMLTAFRTEALKHVNGFTLNHLIEDYDITVRIKRMGWIVAIAQDAQAWTEVPETLAGLWRQRVRWCYWGLIVVKDNIKFLSAIFQDFLGHFVFLSMMALIIISMFFYQETLSQNIFIEGIVLISMMQFTLSYVFGLITMVYYEDKDRVDWLLRLGILPELLYSNVMALILFGAYIYFFYTMVIQKLTNRTRVLHKPYEAGLKGFARVGYVHNTWVTRISQTGDSV